MSKIPSSAHQLFEEKRCRASATASPCSRSCTTRCSSGSVSAHNFSPGARERAWADGHTRPILARSCLCRGYGFMTHVGTCYVSLPELHSKPLSRPRDRKRTNQPLVADSVPYALKSASVVRLMPGSATVTPHSGNLGHVGF